MEWIQYAEQRWELSNGMKETIVTPLFRRTKYMCHLWYIGNNVERILKKLQEKLLWKAIAYVQDRKYTGDQKLCRIVKINGNNKDKI